jgi:hypothetical protein
VTRVEPDQPDEDPIDGSAERFTSSRRLLGFKTAMGSYAVLAVLGAVTLTGLGRIFILILVAGLAIKTYVHHLRDHLE